MNNQRVHARLARLGYGELKVKKIFNSEGVRMTDCCGASSKIVDGDLFCSECFDDVKKGEGDGTETKEKNQ